MNESPPSAELELLLAHGEGEIGRVAVAGLPPIPGDSPGERLAWLNGEGDFLRRFLCSEPRGAAQMSTNLVLPPPLARGRRRPLRPPARPRPRDERLQRDLHRHRPL